MVAERTTTPRSFREIMLQDRAALPASTAVAASESRGWSDSASPQASRPPPSVTFSAPQRATAENERKHCASEATEDAQQKRILPPRLLAMSAARRERERFAAASAIQAAARGHQQRKAWKSKVPNPARDAQQQTADGASRQQQPPPRQEAQQMPIKQQPRQHTPVTDESVAAFATESISAAVGSTEPGGDDDSRYSPDGLSDQLLVGDIADGPNSAKRAVSGHLWVHGAMDSWEAQHRLATSGRGLLEMEMAMQQIESRRENRAALLASVARKALASESSVSAAREFTTWEPPASALFPTASDILADETNAMQKAEAELATAQQHLANLLKQQTARVSGPRE